MILSLFSNDSELLKAFQQSGFFRTSLVSGLEEAKESQVLVISDQQMTFNELSLSFENETWLKNKIIFYLLSEGYKEQTIHHMTSLSKTRNIIILPAGFTVRQIVSRIVEKIFPDAKENKQNIITFFGADSKVGTTMIAQSTAEMLAQNTNADIGLFFLNGKPSTCYMKRKDKIGLDDIKIKLMNNILTSNELTEACVKENHHLYILPGAEFLLDVRHYHPEHIEQLIKLAAERFSLIIIDAGHNIDSGMAIAALNMTKNKYLVTTQQEMTRKNYERMESQVFRRLQIEPDDFMLVVNKYVNTNRIYSAKQVSDLYRMTLAVSVPHLEFLGWQAEFDQKTLLHYDNESYNRHVDQLAKIIATQAQIPYLERDEKKTGILKKAFSTIGGAL